MAFNNEKDVHLDGVNLTIQFLSDLICDCVVTACFVSEQGGIFMSSGTYVSHSAVTEKSLMGQICPTLRLQNNKKKSLQTVRLASPAMYFVILKLLYLT